ncbi:MAG: hypothetical protein QMC67_01635 [Candidatus Wallbacteria bacterium]
MFSTFFVFFNFLIFFGIGAEIIIGRGQLGTRHYFSAISVNSAAMVAVSTGLSVIIKFFPFLSGYKLFIISMIMAFFINECLFAVIGYKDPNFFDSLNLFSTAAPFFINTGSYGNNVPLLALGAACGFFAASALFYFIKLRIYEETHENNEFNIFCYELISFGLLSVAFSIFFKVV